MAPSQHPIRATLQDFIGWPLVSDAPAGRFGLIDMQRLTHELVGLRMIARVAPDGVLHCFLE